MAKVKQLIVSLENQPGRLAAVAKVLADAKVNKTFAEAGMDRYPQDEETPEAASALLKREIKLWGDVIRANHIAAQ